jgi:UDP-N-acetylglucosamine 2-epimerase (non-hydrolysing)
MAEARVQHIVVVVGTRPEAIKQAPVVLALRGRPDRFRVTLLSTGQHREMLQDALASFGLAADVDLNVMVADQTLGGLTARLLEGCQSSYQTLRPDWVLVQGDTTTAFAAALAALYARIPVAHIEAGLRTHDMGNPFPEEANRRLVGVLAQLHFSPTPLAARALKRDGIPEDRIVVTGNTVVDAMELLRQGARQKPSFAVTEAVTRSNGKLVLVTCHRRESFGSDLAAIIEAVATIAAEFPDRTILFPVHLNPHVRLQVLPCLSKVPNVVLTEPVGYADILHVLDHAELVITDSGGLQEEAPSFGVPVIVIRRTTERPEGIRSGFARLVAPDRDGISALAARWLKSNRRKRLVGRLNPYGDGRAAQRIVEHLLRQPAA